MRETQSAMRFAACAPRPPTSSEPAGHPATDATLERVAKTLHAGSATEQGRSLLREGRLAEELEPEGFGVLAGVKPAAPRPAKKKAPDESRARKARADADAASSDADAAAVRVHDAERALDGLRRAAERAAAKAERLRAKAEELEQ